MLIVSALKCWVFPKCGTRHCGTVALALWHCGTVALWHCDTVRGGCSRSDITDMTDCHLIVVEEMKVLYTVITKLPTTLQRHQGRDNRVSTMSVSSKDIPFLPSSPSHPPHYSHRLRKDLPKNINFSLKFRQNKLWLKLPRPYSSWENMKKMFEE